MADAVAVMCECGHANTTHGTMGCMVQGTCSYGYTHYCVCEGFKEVKHESDKSHDDVVG